MVLAQAVVEPSVSNSPFLVQLLIAVTPLLLGILTVLVKQFSTARVLKKNEEHTQLAFGVVDDKLSSLQDKVENLIVLQDKVERLGAALQNVSDPMSPEEIAQLVEQTCDRRLEAVLYSISDLDRQIIAIAEKLNVALVGDSEAERAAVEFRKSYFLKLVRVSDMFPTNKKLVNFVNQFFVDYMNLIEEVIYDLDNWATKDIVKSMFDVMFAEALSNLSVEFGSEFAGLVKRELSPVFKKSVCDIVGIIFDIANVKVARIYGVALSFVGLALSLWLKVYQ